jgi:iron-sulfur cluster repair protein YtfE (RIC family)
VKRHPALIRLSREHYLGLLLAQQMKHGAAPYKGYPADTEGKIKFLFSDYEEKLKPHFAAEENILFPAVKNLTPQISSLVDELIEEHRKIFLLVEEVKSATDKKEQLNIIGVLLEQHLRKEERQLFEMIQQTMIEKDLYALEKKLNG